MDDQARPLRVYFAARYSRIKEMREIRSLIEDAGGEVTSRWVNGSHQYEEPDLIPAGQHYQDLISAYQDDTAERFAVEDLDDVDRADMVIGFSEPPRVASTSRGGRHVEFGYALGKDKEMLLVGPRENVFHHLDSVRQFNSAAAMWDWLKPIVQEGVEDDEVK